ncbi:DDT domain-containing protein DDR4-like isoform X1 [Apium graveolens]|uniref:DDT domain-containing protein DDR4-like isoform X1 n=1 Tax=Apium graveolens TaxID=4045 RepID=UPI003D79F4F9
MDVADDRKAVPSSEIDQRTKLRKRCELATVLNFLSVFEPLLKSKMKVTAEDIEMAIIEPNDLLAKLHVMLLKGIPPVSKTLDRTDAWVTALCKKLTDWWPWVADGDLPLTENKGKEISKYKELEPTTRLVVLKALCEIRLKQGDAVSYINSTMKTGSEVSTFRKKKICGDERGTLYWLDGNDSIGYRLYKEVRGFESKQNDKGKGFLPVIDVQWETLATSLEEFREVVEFSSSKIMMEVDVCKTVEANVIPVLEKLHKKREREAKQQKTKEAILSGFQFYGLTRTCRTRTAVCYTYDEYDKRISEAISVHQRQPKKRKMAKEREDVKKLSDNKKATETASKESSGSEMRPTEDSKHGDNEKGSESISQEDSELDIKAQGGVVPDSETESERQQDVDIDDNMKSEDIVSDSETESERHEDGDIDDNSDVAWDEEINDASSEDDIASNSSDKENNNLGNNHVTCARRREGLPRSKTVAGVVSPAQENSNQGAKDRPRGRLTRKSSLESFVAPDSEETSSSADSSGRSSSVNLSDDSVLG